LFIGCKNSGTYKLKETNILITEILFDFSLKEDISNNSTLIFLNIYESKKKKIDVRISSFEKNGFSYLDSSVGIPVGFYKFKNKYVIVYGNKADMFFQKTSNREIIDYLPIGNNYQKENNISNFPPIIFDPIVFLYEVNNNKFTFKNCDMFLSDSEILFQDDSTIVTVINGDTLTTKVIRSPFE
jgi:hypothetical protein